MKAFLSPTGVFLLLLGFTAHATPLPPFNNAILPRDVPAVANPASYYYPFDLTSLRVRAGQDSSLAKIDHLATEANAQLEKNDVKSFWETVTALENFLNLQPPTSRIISVTDANAVIAQKNPPEVEKYTARKRLELFEAFGTNRDPHRIVDRFHWVSNDHWKTVLSSFEPLAIPKSVGTQLGPISGPDKILAVAEKYLVPGTPDDGFNIVIGWQLRMLAGRMAMNEGKGYELFFHLLYELGDRLKLSGMAKPEHLTDPSQAKIQGYPKELLKRIYESCAYIAVRDSLPISPDRIPTFGPHVTFE